MTHTTPPVVSFKVNIGRKNVIHGFMELNSGKKLNKSSKLLVSYNQKLWWAIVSSSYNLKIWHVAS